MTDPTRFAGRVAVITGGAAGIGLSVASRIVAEGGKVALWDRDPAAIAAATAKLGDSGLGIALDVSDWEAVEAAAKKTADTFGGIDILVASAGITGPNTTTWTYPVEDWRRVIDINLNGVFYCDKAVVPFMLEKSYGRIVNIASIAGKEGNPNAPAYSASKAAVIGLTKSLGKELAKSGVTVNCVTPAAVRTAIFDQMSQSHIDFMLSKIPMGRFGQIEEVAALICWLASDECSFTTGGVFDVSGGRATY
ncbi:MULTISPECIES: SDR family NAD(P)-dependent oxidoreductase [unclassified Chelatococcus]|uniref:SDR family NAD(P)-dependent oxidoreductase n=1 Tax=unclassified Chelatococcus TaxID=2638111 RepID=UPI001BCAF4F8|nr:MULTISPECIES: SDR family NAD(P)-dependent oxidoreductase [unclassified Chelatococcus]CAH1650790.1 2-dehydro-3-deoxy-L-rhamnonate dehydrogenase (NAD(+)) [Hyphomicrobiales bacterium]MBS7743259.1 SDR family oxidoreductase [Chelatococcus sp. HY11]MBX3541623.1 SDR family oxidoreductase [Chelatococcus sp.]MCO5074485.1 SDR family oxidoreductase [Chelatococcus sp.]CAH1692860.1 2-dehydro-3-deoxy-L-rhamnonate dehydrogenase (NAD(+)) [Hyphomicrobiales bacterium]